MEGFRGEYYRRHEVAFMMANFANNFVGNEGQMTPGLVGSGTNHNKARSYWEIRRSC